MLKKSGTFEEKWLSQAGEQQYAFEAVQAVIDRAPNSVAEINPETPTENIVQHIAGFAEKGESMLTLSRTELAQLIEVSRNDVIYTEPIFSLLQSFKTATADVPRLGKKTVSELIDALIKNGCALRSEKFPSRITVEIATLETALWGANMEEPPAVNPSWYRIAGMIQCYAYILQDLETDYKDFLEFSLDADAQGVNDTYLMIAQNGVKSDFAHSPPITIGVRFSHW